MKFGHFRRNFGQDRILFQSADGGNGGSRLSGRGYSARHEAAWRVSDHRPVTLLLEAALPTAEQQLDRDLRVLGAHLTPAVRSTASTHPISPLQVCPRRRTAC